MKSISTATGDEHKSSRDNDNAHSEIHHWARFFGVDAGLHIPLLCHLCLKAAMPSVRSQGEQLAV